MRAAYVCVVSLTGLLLFATVDAATPTVLSRCSTSAGMQDASKHTKPSSFAPQERPANNAYGAPVGDKVLKRRAKKKPATTVAPQPAL